MKSNRLISQLIVIVMISLSIMSPTFAENEITSDISDNNVKAAVERLSCFGIINGMEDGKYHPDEPVTREQFAKLLVVTLGLEDDISGNNTETVFSDVYEDRWSAGYINVAVQQGIIKGYPDGTFRPTETVNYGEALTMFIRSLGYTDDYLQGTWPQNYISKALELKVIESSGFTTESDVDRGSVAIIINNGLEVPMFQESTSEEIKTLLSSVLNQNGNDSSTENTIQLTLEQAIEIALRDNPTIEQAKIKLEGKKVDYEKTKSSIEDNKEVLEKQFSTKSTTYLDQIVKNEISNNLNWEIAQREYQDTLDIQIRKVQEAYFGVLHSNKAVEIYMDNLKLAENLFEKTKKEFGIGKVTETDVATSEINYEKAQKDLSNSEKKLESMKMELNIMLGHDVIQEFELMDELEYENFEEIDIDESINLALKRSTDLLKDQLTYEVAKIEMDIAEKLYTKNVYTYREKEVAFNEAEKKLETTIKMIEKDIRNKYSTITQINDSIEISKKSVELAQTVLDSTTMSYDLGMAVLTDVQQAQIKLQTEKLSLAEEILDYTLAILEFKESLGNEIE